MVKDIILCVCNTLAAWIFALLFIRRKWTEILFNALAGAAVNGILCAILLSLSFDRYLPGVEIIWFLFMTMIIQLQRKDSYGNAVIAFFLVQGVYSVFSMIGAGIYQIGEMAGILFYTACLAGAAGITFMLKDRFPSEEWREYYTNSSPEPERISIQIWHVYGVMVIGSGVLSACRWWLKPEGTAAYLAAGIGCFCFFWLEILLLILMQAYKKERIEVLIEQQYKNEMQSFMNVIRSQRHDYNFHVQTIAGLINDENYDACKKYVDALERDSMLMNAVLPIKDPAISAMIHNFQMLALREGISLHIDIQNDLSQIATNVYETNKIISNLLQNAIDETKTHTDKSYGIHLTVLKQGEYCVIRVSNELTEEKITPGEIEKIYRQGYTTKQGHEGVGLSSIRLLAKRYHGTVYTQTEGKCIHFVAKIPVNIAKNQEAE